MWKVDWGQNLHGGTNVLSKSDLSGGCLPLILYCLSCEDGGASKDELIVELPKIGASIQPEASRAQLKLKNVTHVLNYKGRHTLSLDRPITELCCFILVTYAAE